MTKRMMMSGMLVMVLLAGVVQAGNLYWSGDGSSQGGNGIWNTNSVRWGSSAGGPFGSVWVNANNDTAIFGNTAGTILLGTNVQVGNLQFGVTGYTISGTNTVTFGTANTLTVNVARVTLADGLVVTNAGVEISGNGNSLTLTNGARFFNNATMPRIGFACSSNTFTIVGGGAATSTFNGSGQTFSFGQAGVNLSDANQIVIDAGGVMTNVGAALFDITFPIGWAQGPGGLASRNQLVVADGGRLYALNNLQVGFYFGNVGGGNGGVASSNGMLIANSGTVSSAGGMLVGTDSTNPSGTAPGYGTTSFNTLTITNMGQLFTAGDSYIGRPNHASSVANNNLVNIVGNGGATPSLWNVGGRVLNVGVGSAGTATGNVLRVDGGGAYGGAIVTNVAITFGGNGNSVTLTNGAQMFSSAGVVWVNGFSNTLAVAGGATSSLFYGSSNQFSVSQNVGINNQVLVGSGGIMTNLGYYASFPEVDFAVGWAQAAGMNAYSNQLVVNGGKLHTLRNLAFGFYMGNVSAGGSASSNAMVVSNGGLVRVGAGGCIYVGSDSTNAGATFSGITSFNSLTLASGGQFFTFGDSYIGRAYRANSAAHNNSATVGGSLNGTNALWNLGGAKLFVGSAASGTATGNVLAVNAGGVVTNLAALIVSASNTLSLATGSQVYAGAVTNAGRLSIVMDRPVELGSSCLKVLGNLNVTNASLNLAFAKGGWNACTVIASYGTFSGPFVATNGLPSGGRVVYGYNGGNQIAVVLPVGTVLTLR